MGNNNKVFTTDKHEKKSEHREGYLSSDKISAIEKYFRYSAMIFHSVGDYLYGSTTSKIAKAYESTYDFVVLIFFWIIFGRNLLLATVEDLTFRSFLGETARVRPARQLKMAMSIWSLYVAILFTIYFRCAKKRYMHWLQPFQLLCGNVSPKSLGLDMEMTDRWYLKSMKKWKDYLWAANIRSIIGLTTFIWLVWYRWNDSNLVNTLNIFWSLVLILWSYYSSTAIYISYIYFDTLCFYFRMRFNKVNNDIESIIAPNNNLKPHERAQILHHVLIEHNDLCLHITEYNKFWAKYLMGTYFFLVTIICFTTFQAFFTSNMIIVRMAMFLITLEASYILTKISICAALMSNEAHASYNRLIRVTFDKYPVDLQIQLRMFIQRLSGPSIGFYCLDLFEITYTTYASIIAALGQNFLLIVDFVRSYAEVGKDRSDAYDVSMSESVDQFFTSDINSTLSSLSLTGPEIDNSHSPFNMSIQ